MEANNKFLFARQILTKELNKIGGEIFADKLVRLQAEHGNKESQKEVAMQDIFLKIISHESKESEAERNLSELVDAILVLHNQNESIL